GGSFVGGRTSGPADAGAAEQGAPDPCGRGGEGAKGGVGRSDRRPSRAGEWDALHLRSSFDAKDGPAVGPQDKTLSKNGLGKVRPDVRVWHFAVVRDVRC